MAFPLMVRAIRLSIEAVDPRLEEAAGTLGAGRGWTFLTITLPLILPGILAGRSSPSPRPGRVRRHDHLRLQHPRRDPDPAVGDLHLPAGAGRRGRRAAADAGLDRHRDGGAARLGGRSRGGWRAGSPAMRLSVEVALRHGFGGFALDAAFAAPAGADRAVRPSGAGKTTLVNAIAGLLRPDRGRVVVDGDGAARHRARRLRAAASPADRLCLPGGAAVPAPDGAAEPAATAAGSRRERRGAADSTTSSTARHRRTCSRARPARCPAARSSGSRSAGRCWRARASC